MAVPVLICLVSAAVFLVAAVDGEDDAEGEQGVLRVCDLEGVAAAERQKFTLTAECVVLSSTDVTSIVNSTQAPSRHIEGST